MVNEDGFWLQREHGEKMRKGAVQLTRRKDKDLGLGLTCYNEYYWAHTVKKV
jgi:hypothetical protein